MIERIYKSVLRYTCVKCGDSLVREWGPLILLCDKCDGYMKWERSVKIEGDDLVRHEYSDGECYIFRFGTDSEKEFVDLSLRKSIKMERSKRRGSHSLFRTLAIFFGLPAGWKGNSARNWMSIHFPIVREESTQSLANVPPLLRQMFHNDLKQYVIWREFYIASLDEPLPELAAWAMFKMKFVKDRTGRWISRK